MTLESTDNITPLAAHLFDSDNELSNFLALDIPPLEWIVDRIIPKASLGLLLASEKVGKSLFAADSGICIIRGESFLGRETQKANVGFIEEEGHAGAWQDRFRCILRNRPTATDPGRFRFLHRKQFRLDNGAHMQALRDWIREHELGVVFMGPLAQIGNIVDENKPEEISKITGILNLLVAETGCTIVIIHHRNKGGRDDNSYTVSSFMKTTRGSGALAGAVDFAIGLQRDAEDSHGKMYIMQREAQSSFHHYKFDFETLRITSTDAPVTKADQRRRDAIRFLFENPGPRSRAELDLHLGTDEKKTLDTLKSLGDKVERSGAGRTTTYELTPDLRAQMEHEAAEARRLGPGKTDIGAILEGMDE